MGVTSIEIPRVEALSPGDQPLEHVSTVCHLLLTALLRHDDTLLHAEHRRPAPQVTWYVRRRSDERKGDDEAVAVLPSAIM